jgi:phospholipid/cholesterol/gamma-HCH transport system substrate-binding protein
MPTRLVFGIQTGLFVLLGLTALAFLTMQLPAKHLELFGAGRGYRITAQFDDIGSLKVGDPVNMAGVPVGQVESIALDRADYRALVTMRIRARYNRIPLDSEASIDTVGLLGGQYVAIGPGRSESYLSNGGRLTSTQSAFVLEDVVNRLFGALASKAGDDSTQP